MLRLNTIARGVSLMVGGSALLVFSTAQAQAPQRVEITGSAIKRTDTETPAPVEVITRKDIERIGATSINELIKSIPSIDIQDAGELSSNSPGGSGTARVRLRGLGDTNTLVLVNGRRVPVNPLADASGAGAAFNISQLPIAAIERVEILKDGGSAIYGADAVAGVVNFILRKDFRGAEGAVLLGTSSRSDGEEKSATVTVGFGDLSTQRFNVLASLDIFKRDPILRKDRDISKSVDFRRFGTIPGFNLDGRSSFAPEGNILNANGSFSGLTVQPCAPENFTNGACRYDFNASLLTAYNGADRVSALVAGNFAITPDLLAYARFMGSTDDNHFDSHPVPDNFVLPAPDGRRYAGRFMQGGPRITDKATKFNNLDLGVDGAIGKFDVRFGISSGKAEATNSDQNYYDRAKYDAATAAKLFDPTVTTNSQAVIDSLKINPVRFASSRLDSVDGLVSGDVMKLPGGMSRFAVGFSAWKEDLVDQPDPRQIAGTVVGSIQQSAVLAERKAHAFFGELQLPITRTLEGQLAVRYDKYDTSDATTPKVALKWKAMPQLALRGSYSESFKMPTLKQLFANAGQGAINFTESQCRALGFPAGCAGLSGFRVTGSNPGLQPEKGKSYNLGLVADVGVFSGSVDFWRIMKTNNISTLTIDSAITDGFFAFDQSLARYVVFQNLQNFAQTRNTGIDVDAQIKLRGTGFGNVTLRGATTYYTSQATRNRSGDTWAEFNGTYNTPRWRSSVTATVENGAWTSQMLVRNWAGYYDTTQSQQGFKNLVAGGLRDVEGYEEVDFTVSYSGIKNLVLTASIKNAFDRQPPFSATNATNNNFSQQGFSEIYGSRGRYYQLGAKYSFK